MKKLEYKQPQVVAIVMPKDALMAMQPSPSNDPQGAPKRRGDVIE